MGWLDFFKKSKAKKAEEKELKWILLEFYRLKLIHSSLKNAKKDPKNAKEQITKAFKLLRNEEKIERRLAKGFSKLEEAIGKELERLEQKHSKKLQPFAERVLEIKKLLEAAEVFNADLEKEAAKGGEIERLLEASTESFSKLDETINEIEKVLKELRGFEIVLGKIKTQISMIDEEIEKDLKEEKKEQKIKEVVVEINPLIELIRKKINELKTEFSEIKHREEKIANSAKSEFKKLSQKSELNPIEEDNYSHDGELVANYNNLSSAIDDYLDQLYTWSKYFFDLQVILFLNNERVRTILETRIVNFKKLIKEIEDSLICKHYSEASPTICSEVLVCLGDITKLINNLKRLYP